jgi:hypothetical protein
VPSWEPITITLEGKTSLRTLTILKIGLWVAAVDAFGAADRMRAGAAEGGFIYRYSDMSA